jgi:predicted DNA-binding protein
MTQEQMIIRMSPEMKAWVKATAKDLGISASEYIRHKIMGEFATQRNKYKRNDEK